MKSEEVLETRLLINVVADLRSYTTQFGILSVYSSSYEACPESKGTQFL